MLSAKKFYETVQQVQFSELKSPADNKLQMFAFPNNMESKNRASGTLVKMDGFAAGNNSTIFKSVLKLHKNFHIYIHGNRSLIEKGVDEKGRKNKQYSLG